MKNLIYFLLTISHFTIYSQDLSGIWEGTLTQAPNKSFSFKIDISQSNGKIYGYSIIESGNAIGKFRVRGFFDGDNILITETNKESSGNWCKKFYKLTLKETSGNYFLEGDWNSLKCYGIGQITLNRKENSPVKLLNKGKNLLSGTWTGTLIQETKDFDFYYQLIIPEFESNNLGTSFIIAETNNGGSANHLLSYTFLENEKKLIIEEQEIIYRFNNRWVWCVKEAELKLTEYDDKLVLEGKWWGNEKSEADCPPGTIYLEKQLLKLDEKVEYKEDRKINVSKQIKTKAELVSISFWDHGQVDNDTVSVYLNNTKVVDNIRLSDKREEIEIELSQKENYFVFHAENLGDIPPNTASFIIRYEDKMEKVILNADLMHSDAILFLKEE